MFGQPAKKRERKNLQTNTLIENLSQSPEQSRTHPPPPLPVNGPTHSAKTQAGSLNTREGVGKMGLSKHWW
jgi:hypothetical protein